MVSSPGYNDRLTGAMGSLQQHGVADSVVLRTAVSMDGQHTEKIPSLSMFQKQFGKKTFYSYHFLGKLVGCFEAKKIRSTVLPSHEASHNNNYTGEFESNDYILVIARIA